MAEPAGVDTSSSSAPSTTQEHTDSSPVSSVPSSASAPGEPHAEAVHSPPFPEGAVDVGEKKDGGIMKVVRREGISEGELDRPAIGDQVSVHYVGTLWGGKAHGEQFDSSRDRGEQFEFTLGRGQVIKGWDQGVASMKRGELADLYIKAEYAYGKTGQGKIPPNATLKFEIELFSWLGEDLSENKDGSIRKSTVVKGEGYLTPNDDAMVEVSIVGKFGNTVFDQRENLQFALGDGYELNIPSGLEKALKHLKKKESARLTLAPSEGFGNEGTSKLAVPVPPDTPLSYEVHMVNFEKAKETWQLQRGEKLDQAEILKSKGARACTAGRWERALELFKRVTTYLDFEGDFKDPEDLERRNKVLLAAHLNKALCQLKLQEFKEAIVECDKALQFDARAEKALFRRAQAFQFMNEYEDAAQAYKKVLEVEPTNTAASKHLQFCEQRIREQKFQERRMYAGIFGRLSADADSHPQAPSPASPTKAPKSEPSKATTNGTAAGESESTSA